MPIIRNGSRQPARAAGLTRRLATELAHPHATGQPLILDNQIGQVQRYYVTVVWDEWADLEPVARSRVVLDAYESAMPERTGQIAIAMGLTMADAISMGLFPYRVLPHAPEQHPDFLRRMLDAMRAEPGVTIAVDGYPQLRFRTMIEATETTDRLKAAVPSSEWIITRDVRTARDESDD